jgi:hypothetical protein
MSPKFETQTKEEPIKPEIKVEPKQTAPELTRPFTIMTENDAYISERMKDQPQTLADIEVFKKEERLGIHRLSLPDDFEPFSYDCTVGISCPHHGWKMEEVSYGLDKKMARWTQTKRGKYVFRWLSKVKRALDFSINVRGWYLVNRTYFSDCSKILFSVNGGVENGDSILGFMPVAKAIKIRNKPAEDSNERVSSEEKRHEQNPNFYKAKLDSERTEGDDFAPADALQEGRDFKT